jgi:hypothetical protein
MYSFKIYVRVQAQGMELIQDVKITLLKKVKTPSNIGLYLFVGEKILLDSMTI